MVTRTALSKPLNAVKLAKALTLIWVTLSLAEASVTYLCLRTAENIEGNPFGRMLLSHNEAVFYGSKLLVTAAIGWGLWWLARRTPHIRMLLACQILLVTMFVGVLINNLLHL
jgi:hypothetical protein